MSTHATLNQAQIDAVSEALMMGYTHQATALELRKFDAVRSAKFNQLTLHEKRLVLLQAEDALSRESSWYGIAVVLLMGALAIYAWAMKLQFHVLLSQGSTFVFGFIPTIVLLWFTHVRNWRLKFHVNAAIASTPFK